MHWPYMYQSSIATITIPFDRFSKRRAVTGHLIWQIDGSFTLIVVSYDYGGLMLSFSSYFYVTHFICVFCREQQDFSFILPLHNTDTPAIFLANYFTLFQFFFGWLLMDFRVYHFEEFLKDVFFGSARRQTCLEVIGCYRSAAVQ